MEVVMDLKDVFMTLGISIKVPVEFIGVFKVFMKSLMDKQGY